MSLWENPNIDRNAHIQTTPWKWTIVKAAYLILGRQTDIGAHTVLLCHQGIEIQDNAQIGPNCSILSVSTIDGKQGKVTIKKNARIGAGSVVMPGVTVGENAVVGALTFVNCDIPDNETWIGIPCHKLSKSI